MIPDTVRDMQASPPLASPSLIPTSGDWSKQRVHFTGIKGTGMTALAEILAAYGAHLSGSDVAERFFTDELLAAIHVVPRVGFAADHVPEDATMLVYSAAYSADNPERVAAAHRGIPQFSYTQMLGALSRSARSLAVSGVHGKTSTTALAGTIVRHLNLSATVIVGSAVPSFGGSATLRNGREALIAETCEYRRHFLDFSPAVLLVTSVEADHLDYFRDADDVADAFVEFGDRLASGGTVIACSDDPGARAVAQRIGERRTDVTVQLYGTSVNGVGNVAIGNPERGTLPFAVTLSDGAVAAALRVPGRHMALNAAGAILALQALWPDTPINHDALRAALARFRGTRRRSEVLGEWNGVLYVDDYAHHPAAIRTTLAGYRAFWPGRRIVVDFMSHTFSRTAALLDGFAGAFSDADIVLLNDIYASARETPIAGISGERLAAAIAAHHPAVEYHPSFDEAVARARTLLRPGDLFVTMGAGNNNEVGARLVAEHKKGSHDA